MCVYLCIYSDKQQLSHKIGWPVTHMHTYMRACRPAYSQVRPALEISHMCTSVCFITSNTLIVVMTIIKII